MAEPSLRRHLIQECHRHYLENTGRFREQFYRLTPKERHEVLRLAGMGQIEPEREKKKSADMDK